MRYGKTLTSLVTVVLGLGAAGCETHTGNGALLGGAGGALVGAAIGSHSHQRAGEGALLGGAIGAIGGAIVGNEMDRQERSPRYYDYDRGGYSRGYSRGRYYDDRPEYYRYERRSYRPRYDDCERDGRYEYRSYRGYGRARYYETTYYGYD
jgi:outer membrane protein with glycine zipper